MKQTNESESMDDAVKARTLEFIERITLIISQFTTEEPPRVLVENIARIGNIDPDIERLGEWIDGKLKEELKWTNGILVILSTVTLIKNSKEGEKNGK